MSFIQHLRAAWRKVSGADPVLGRDATVEMFDLGVPGETQWHAAQNAFRRTPLQIRRKSHGLELRIHDPILSTMSVAAVGLDHHRVSMTTSEEAENTVRDLLYSVSDYIVRLERDHGEMTSSIACGLAFVLFEPMHASMVVQRAQELIDQARSVPPEHTEEGPADVEESVETSRQPRTFMERPDNPIQGDYWIDPRSGAVHYYVGESWVSVETVASPHYDPSINIRNGDWSFTSGARVDGEVSEPRDTIAESSPFSDYRDEPITFSPLPEAQLGLAVNAGDTATLMMPDHYPNVELHTDTTGTVEDVLRNIAENPEHDRTTRRMAREMLGQTPPLEEPVESVGPVVRLPRRRKRRLEL